MLSPLSAIKAERAGTVVKAHSKQGNTGNVVNVVGKRPPKAPGVLLLRFANERLTPNQVYSFEPGHDGESKSHQGRVNF